MEPAETEFIAEKTFVEVVPNFNHSGAIHLISGDFGPFRAGIPINVPLWLGVTLKQRNKCRILPPAWMDITKLEEKKEEEKNSKFFTKMPHDYYMEVSHVLLGAASDDIERADDIRTIVKDLWDMRISKLRSSIDTFIKGGGIHATLNHLTELEINSVRPILPDSLKALESFIREVSSDNDDESSQSNVDQPNASSGSIQ